MGKIQDYTATTPVRASKGPRATQEAFGAGLTRGLSQLNQEIAEARLKQDKLEYNKIITEVELAQTQREKELLQSDLGELSYSEAVLQDFDNKMDTVVVPDSMVDQFSLDRDRMKLNAGRSALSTQAQIEAKRAQFDYDKTVRSQAEIVAEDISKLASAKSRILSSTNSLPIAPELREQAAFTANKIFSEKVLNARLQSSPIDLMNEIDAGIYDGTAEPDELRKFKKWAQDRVLKLKDEADIKRLGSEIQSYPDTWEKFVSGEMTLDMAADEHASGNMPSLLYNHIRKELTEKIPNNFSTDKWNELFLRYQDLFSKGDLGMELNDADRMAEALKFQEDVIQARKDGLIHQNDMTNWFKGSAAAINPTIEGGYEGWINTWGDYDAIDRAYGYVNDLMEKSGRESDTNTKIDFMRRFSVQLDRLGIDQQIDNEEDSKKVMALLNSMTLEQVRSTVPSLNAIEDDKVPNGVIPKSGKPMIGLNPKSKAKADIDASGISQGKPAKINIDGENRSVTAFHDKDGNVSHVEYIDSSGKIKRVNR
jgi:hypothetical protein